MNKDVKLTTAKMLVPGLKIEFKDHSKLMKTIGFLMFFNKQFMTQFITTIGSTIYFPNEQKFNEKEIASVITVCHEIVHVLDSKKYFLLFQLGYLFPQILALLSIPLFFVNIYIGLAFLLFLLPLPAYFRMVFEKRAYLTEIYTAYNLSKRYNFKYDIDLHYESILKNFNSSNYYWMWVFDLNLDTEISKIRNGEAPFEDSDVYTIIDKIIIAD